MITHHMRVIPALPALEPTKIPPLDYHILTAKLTSGGPDVDNWSHNWWPSMRS